jgi:hypothetical protein
MPDEHAPPRQLCPQAPQLFGSVCVFVQAPPQKVGLAAGQVHAPALQVCPPVHTAQLEPQ